MSFRVPMPLTMRSFSGWSTEFWFAKKAARWKTMSGFSKKIRLSLTSSRMSPSTNITFGRLGTFQRAEAQRLSSTNTRLQIGDSARVRLLPMAPAPPVMKTVLPA